MSTKPDTCLPTTTWYLFLEDVEPLGQIYRCGVPEVNAEIQGREHFQTARVVSFTELRATCAMRRFRVVLRVIS